MAAEALERPLKDSTVDRAHDWGAGLSQVPEGTMVELDHLGTSRRHVARGSRREPDTVEKREHGSASILGAWRAWPSRRHHLSSGGAPGGCRPLRPILLLLERGGENLREQPVGARLPIVRNDLGCREGQPGTAGARCSERASPHQARFAENIEVGSHGVDMQADALGELVRLQRSLRAKGLEQTDPAGAAQGAVRTGIRRRRWWWDDAGRGAHGLDFTRSLW